MAAVYKGYQPAMERFVAIKVLPRRMSESEVFTARFRREARLLAQLQHPHILPVFDYGEAEGYPYIVMPFIVSGTLADLLRDQRLSLSEVGRVITQVGDALGYAHTRGMIHRDIKPSNILIDEGGNCLLTDFGLARMTESEDKLTTSGLIIGTPAYMSPEQGTGSETDPRSDIYSLGIILYEMLTGRVPFMAETPYAVVYKHVQDPPPSAREFNPSLSEELELVLLKCLAKKPGERYQTANAFVQALRQAIAHSPAAGKTLAPQSKPATLAAKGSAKPGEDSNALKKQPSNASEGVNRVPSRFLRWLLGGIGLLGLAILIGAVMMNRSNVPVTATVIPATTSTIAPTGTSAVAISPATAGPTSTPQNPVIVENRIRDDFDNQLAEGWIWLAEDKARWSLSEVPGWLQILASDASFDGPSFPTNVLLRDPPEGDFEMTTLLQFTPTSNFQFSGLVVFQDKANALQFGRAFCDLADSCVGDGIYFDNFEGGFIVANHKAPIRGSQIYLRLRLVGNTYTGYFSEDGVNWITLGEHTRDFSQARVGLMAAQAAQAIPASFDFFTITRLQQ